MNSVVEPMFDVKIYVTVFFLISILFAGWSVLFPVVLAVDLRKGAQVSTVHLMSICATVALQFYAFWMLRLTLRKGIYKAIELGRVSWLFLFGLAYITGIGIAIALFPEVL